MIRTYLGHTPVIPASCYVDVSAQILGEVTLGEHSSVWMNAVLRGDVHSIRLGANSNVQDCAVLHGMRYKWPVIVGDWVTIGHNATVHGCVIEDACLIGMQATVLDDAVIGAGSVVGAGAVITQRMVIPPRSLVLGVPAKVVKTLTDAEEKFHRAHAAKYVRLKENYLRDARRVEPR